MSEDIKKFEKALGNAMKEYLRAKQTLTNGHGEVFSIGDPACIELYLHLRDDYDKQQIENLIDCSTNPYPCLLGEVTLNLKVQEDSAYSYKTYFFHICGEKLIHGDADYSLTTKNDTLTITIKNIDYFLGHGTRIW